jgi:hypothetical protein
MFTDVSEQPTSNVKQSKILGCGTEKSAQTANLRSVIRVFQKREDLRVTLGLLSDIVLVWRCVLNDCLMIKRLGLCCVTAYRLQFQFKLDKMKKDNGISFISGHVKNTSQKGYLLICLYFLMNER